MIPEETKITEIIEQEFEFSNRTGQSFRFHRVEAQIKQFYPNRESQMVVLKRDSNGKPTVFCDPDIVDLVAALNNGGISTVASCSGHSERNGNIALKDGRELIIANDFADARRIEKLLATTDKGDEK